MFLGRATSPGRSLTQLARSAIQLPRGDAMTAESVDVAALHLAGASRLPSVLPLSLDSGLLLQSHQVQPSWHADLHRSRQLHPIVPGSTFLERPLGHGPVRLVQHWLSDDSSDRDRCVDAAANPLNRGSRHHLTAVSDLKRYRRNAVVLATGLPDRPGERIHIVPRSEQNRILRGRHHGHSDNRLGEYLAPYGLHCPARLCWTPDNPKLCV